MLRHLGGVLGEQVGLHHVLDGLDGSAVLSDFDHLEAQADALVGLVALEVSLEHCCGVLRTGGRVDLVDELLQRGAEVGENLDETELRRVVGGDGFLKVDHKASELSIVELGN